MGRATRGAGPFGNIMVSPARPIKILALTPRARPWPGGSPGPCPGAVSWLPAGPAGSRGTRAFTAWPRSSREAFARGDNLVCIMAAGIVVRGIAPICKGKDRDPAVVVVDEAGSFAISLLSGHLGGANELARRVAKVLGGTPVITTATDVQGLPALDMLAAEHGLTIENLAGVRTIPWLCWPAGPSGWWTPRVFCPALGGASGSLFTGSRPGPGPGRCPRPYGVRGRSGAALATGVAPAAPPEPGGRDGLP